MHVQIGFRPVGCAHSGQPCQKEGLPVHLDNFICSRHVTLYANKLTVLTTSGIVADAAFAVTTAERVLQFIHGGSRTASEQCAEGSDSV